MDLREARKSKGLTQYDIEDLAGILQPNLNVIENGRILPTITTRKKFESILGSDINWIATRLQGAGGETREIIEQVLNFIHSEDPMSRDEKKQFLTELIEIL